MQRWGRVATAVSVLAGLVAVGGPAYAQSTAASPAAVPGTWTVTEIEDNPPGLWGVTEYDYIEPTSSGDVLMASEDSPYQPDYRQPIRCWNGSTWTFIPEPGPGFPAASGHRQYGALGGASCSDFWVFGAASAPKRWHWDGSFWQSAAMSTTDPVWSVKAFAANDIWAFTLNGQGLHFDGSTWRQVSMPPIDVKNVVGRSGTDFWAMGTTPVDAHPYGNAAYRWNGTTWTKGSVPSTYKGYYIYGSLGPNNDVYEFGFSLADGYLRWDGTSWHHEKAGSLTSGIGGVAYAAGALWAASGSGFARLYNGAWSMVAAPPVDDPYGMAIYGLAADPRSQSVFGGGVVGYAESTTQRKIVIQNIGQTG
ncbi:hypothetical protein GCM10023322_51960 [Rugosimonospora acidiphila]|uniref:Uncharacterized protein n=1 Tax=Rugosimonospora acidiphila TaxID=556531 RepID=A0ABP9S7K9_9ACTN